MAAAKKMYYIKIPNNYFLFRPIGINSFRRTYCQDTKDIEKEKELKRIAEEASLDEPPTSCCQSGCANCVYIAWAEALTAKMNDKGPEIVNKIMENIHDPSLRAYLELELRLRGLKK